ncbi:MAG: xanthine dehydrogenase FAD-binding subunit XdhB [Clostridia bacterium]
MYDIDKIYEANSVREAIALLTEHPEAKVIAGGSDVLIKIREGKMAGCTLVSIYGLDELRGVTMLEDGTVRIGALTSFSDVAKDPIIQRTVPVLADAVSQVGGPQIRNIGTIGGNVSNGVTSADSASTLFAFNAHLEIEGPDGVRVTPIGEHYVSAGKVNLRQGDILRAILIRKADYEGHFGHYIKYSMRKAMDIATLGCAVVVQLDEEKQTLSDVRLAFGVAGPIPMRCPGAERAAIGKRLCEETLDAFAENALAEVTPRTSWRASKEFRLQLTHELSRRALAKAIALAGGVIHAN